MRYHASKLLSVILDIFTAHRKVLECSFKEELAKILAFWIPDSSLCASVAPQDVSAACNQLGLVSTGFPFSAKLHPEEGLVPFLLQVPK